MQTPKDIVVYLDAAECEAQRVRLHYAAVLAKKWGAHLVVALVPQQPSYNRHSAFARGDAVVAMFELYKERKEASLKAVQSMIAEFERIYEIECELRNCDGEMGEALMLHARHAGLAVLGSSRGLDGEESALTLSEDVIFASGVPSILVPPKWDAERPVRKVVIGWNASREAARAISDAIPLLVEAEEVRVVVVPEGKINRLLGEDPGADISQHLARYGVRVTLDSLKGSDAGALILAKAAEIDADLIVMGAFGQSKITEFVFGSATGTLLRKATIPILLSR
ncbi:universal stress protein [Tardiphaga alba]|uniref:Universal stress protein n=1 Tax=Tardiphaga alba TaxID=340268 RepID=A0ABX8A3F9_9BRAD|nr:universal stress protein [Tardiphaga alba]QUS37761.1 universal stress protein [Tardiphaga alba]